MNDIEKAAKKLNKFLKKKGEKLEKFFRREALPEIERFLDTYGEEIAAKVLDVAREFINTGDAVEARKEIQRWLRDFIKERIND